MRHLLVFALLAMACASEDTTLCQRFYTPYPDMVAQRERTTRNSDFLDAMALYNTGDFVRAADALGVVIDKEADNRPARMYLASALLGAGQPYKAEMHLDFLERARGNPFKDQTEWYNALCWLCSGQYERAMRQAEAIANAQAHTYKTQAQELNDLLHSH